MFLYFYLSLDLYHNVFGQFLVYIIMCMVNMDTIFITCLTRSFCSLVLYLYLYLYLHLYLHLYLYLYLYLYLLRVAGSLLVRQFSCRHCSSRITGGSITHTHLIFCDMPRNNNNNTEKRSPPKTTHGIILLSLDPQVHLMDERINSTDAGCGYIQIVDHRLNPEERPLLGNGI